MEAPDSRFLRTYMWLVSLGSLPLIVLVSLAALDDGLVPLHGSRGVVVVLFSLVLVAGEMWPIPVTRGEEGGDEITVSSTFGFALLLVAPVFYTVLAQTISLVLDWKIRKRRWQRLPFNIAQYSLSFILARALYAHVAGVPFEQAGLVHEPDLLAATVGGAGFLLLNNGLVSVAVAARLGVRVWRVLVEDIRWQLMTSAPLLGLAPLAALAALWTPASIVLLLIPIIALHSSGRHAMKREQEALRDPLTGLANRALLTTAAERALRSGAATTAMLLIDLDHFKEVNDTLGHAVGDDLLCAVAQRLSEQAGATDLVARLGGDEFVLLARGGLDAVQAGELAARVGAAISAPYDVQGVTLTVGASIGIGLAPEHGDTVEGLLRCADVALYTAKVTRGTYAVYDRMSDHHSAALLGLQAELRSALEDPHDKQVFVVFQPQFDLRSQEFTAVEALVRWQHPELGFLLPDNFIPMAESTSLIDLLMHRVLDLSLRQVASWRAGGLPLSVAVNLSARQLSDSTLPDTVAALLSRYDVPATSLVLEVTESRLMSDPQRSIEILGRLRALGVEISIDDFGTGYSSLAYLQQLGVDELKIDKSFTVGLREPGNATIVRSTIELGHNLGLRVIAEGVEDQWAATLLAEMGCDMLQGYYVGRPGRASDLRLDRPPVGTYNAFPRTGTPLRAVPRRKVEELPIPCPPPAAQLALPHQVGR